MRLSPDRTKKGDEDFFIAFLSLQPGLAEASSRPQKPGGTVCGTRLRLPDLALAHSFFRELCAPSWMPILSQLWRHSA